jgi:hypothetical protein
LVYLVKYAYFLAQLGIEVRDKGDLDDRSLDPERYSFVENYNEQCSILDVIGFPREGKQHFAACTMRHRNNPHNACRELDKWFITRRAKHTRRTGRLTGMRFDMRLKRR